MIKIKNKKIKTEGIKLSIDIENQEVARASIYLIHNDLHQEPYALVEDVFIDQAHRGKGLGTELINELITEAKKQNCYKIVATSRNSRPKVHKLYEKLGFENKGSAFRMELE